ncbi:MAG: lysophospholipid acyltransferase family protein [Marinibacterium sp.]
MIRWLVSALFVVQIYLVMLLMGIVFAPYAALTREGAYRACKLYCVWVFFSARWMVGIRTQTRGPVPEDEVLVAAKHQSFLDILILFYTLPRPKFIMKRELLWTPVIGLYARRLGCIPVDRGKRGAAIQKMVADVKEGRRDPGQLVIYPQGTRVAPGDDKPYKKGAAALYEILDQTCIPVATNAGLFWPRTGIVKNPGLAVVEFLPAIAPGLGAAAFTWQLQAVVEPASDALMIEAGFDKNALH